MIEDKIEIIKQILLDINGNPILPLPGNISWVSTNPAIGTIAMTGLFTAIARGKTTIEATIQTNAGPFKAKRDVTVRP